jgi:hypothetical protein
VRILEPGRKRRKPPRMAIYLWVLAATIAVLIVVRLLLDAY